ncbi:MAG TPA: YceI family protein [Chloroflexia bacterium]|nr:YceI family protein [Chloroflexia bacterium]
MTNLITKDATSAKATTWKIDAGHTTVEFVAKHMMITSVRGRFPDVEGTIAFDEENIANSSVEATIQVATVTSGSEQRDTHLRTGDFFLADEYPTMTFKSTRIEPKGNDEYKVTGDLTIRGVTREVTLDTTIEGRSVSPWGTEAIGFSATVTINRKDFGLNWNVALETGGVLVSEKIKIELNIEAVKNVGQAEQEADAETRTGSAV